MTDFARHVVFEQGPVEQAGYCSIRRVATVLLRSGEALLLQGVAPKSFESFVALEPPGKEVFVQLAQGMRIDADEARGRLAVLRASQREAGKGGGASSLVHDFKPVGPLRSLVYEHRGQRLCIEMLDGSCKVCENVPAWRVDLLIAAGDCSDRLCLALAHIERDYAAAACTRQEFSNLLALVLAPTRVKHARRWDSVPAAVL